jgi:hypothetical protein
MAILSNQVFHTLKSSSKQTIIMNIQSSSKTLVLALAATVAATVGAFAQPAMKLEITDDAAGTYKLRDLLTIKIKVENTRDVVNASSTTTAAQADAINAANTGYNTRVSKLLLIGTDIYGNRVTIANQDLNFGVPNGSSELGPKTNLERDVVFRIPNDGTLHSDLGPSYYVQVEVQYNLQGGALGGTLTASTGENVQVAVNPNLRLPTMTFPARTDHRGGEVVQFTSHIYNDIEGDPTYPGRPLRPDVRDDYRLDTYLTTDPQIGGTNRDDFLVHFTDLAGDMGGSAPASTSTIRRIRVTGTPPALPAYGDPSNPATRRIYTPQPDDTYLDIGETLVLDYEILVPQNFRGQYFVAGFIDSLNGVTEGKSDSPAYPGTSISDNHFVSSPAVRFGIQATPSPQMDLVSGQINASTGNLSRAGDDDSDLPSMSRRGEVTAFSSFATNLDSTGIVSNERRHIYAKITNLRTGAVTTRLISRSSAGALANGDCTDPVVSANGRFVAFSSTATNLVDRDNNSFSDIFVHDLLIGTTTRVSVTSTGLQANGASFNPSISADGRYVAFHSRATNLRPAGTASGGGIMQVFVVDRDKDVNGVMDEVQPNKIATYLASINKNGQRADALSYLARISANGEYLAFVSHATNLDSTASKTTSGGGKYGALPFSSIYRIKLDKGSPLRAELDVVNVPDEATAQTAIPGLVADAASYEIAINANGNHIAFTSQATNLVDADSDGISDDSNGVGDVFVRDYSDNANPKTVRVSTSSERSATGVLRILGSIAGTRAPGNVPTDNALAGDSVILDDGFSGLPLTFTGGGNWTLGANNGASRNGLVNAINNARGTGFSISARATTPAIAITGLRSTATAYFPAMELYNTTPGAAGNTGGAIASGALEFTGMDGGGTQANDPDQDTTTPAEDLLGVPSGSNMPSIDASGRYVAFRSVAANLDVYKPDPNDALPAPRNSLRDGELIRPLANFSSNVYVHDRCVDGRDDVGDGSGKLVLDAPDNSASTRVSVNKFGYPTLFLLGTWSSANSHSPAISGDGLKVAFSSDAENVSGMLHGRNNRLPLDNNERRDVFTYIRGDIGSADDATDTLQSQVIAFDKLPSPARFDQLSTINLKAAATSGLPVTFRSSNTGVATVSGSVLRIHTAGTVTITASQAGDADWDAAAEVEQQLVVTKGKQIITFSAPAPVASGSSRSFQLDVRVNSGQPLTFKTRDAKIATVSQTGLVTVPENANGTTIIEVSQPGNANWEAATTVEIPVVANRLARPDIVFTLTAAEKSQTVATPRKTITLRATSTNTGVPVTFRSSNPTVVAVQGNIATILAPGTADIFAEQAATGSFQAPPSVRQTIVVSKGTPTALKALAAATFPAADVTLETVDSLGRPITHTSSNANVARVVSGKLQIVGAGSAVIRSVVKADGNFAGMDQNRTMTVRTGTQRIAWNAPTTMIDGTIKASPAPARTTGGVAITYTSSNPSIVRASGNSITILGKGFATVTATAAASSNYQAAAPVAYRVGRPY